MKLARTFYQLTAALAVLSIECVYGTDQIISLSLQVSTYERECSGGDGGLTNTSIEVQSRLLQGASVVSEWCILIVIDPKQGFNGTLNIHYNGNSVNGIQLKLLQLEHGGGNCNCWKAEDVSIFMESRSVRLFGPGHYGYCSYLNNYDQNKFCGDAVRGFISKAATIPVSQLHSSQCPAESYTFSVDRDTQPETCTTIPRNAETSTSTPSVETSTSTPSVETSTSTPSVETSTSTPSVETSTSTPSVETSTSAPSVETSISAPSVETSTSAPSDEINTSAPSDEINTSAPSDEINTSAPSDEINTSAPSDEINTGAPSAEMSTTEPSVETSTSVVSAVTTSSSYGQPFSYRDAILDELEYFEEYLFKQNHTTHTQILTQLWSNLNNLFNAKLKNDSIEVTHVIGSSLHSFVDRLALEGFQDEGSVITPNIIVETRLITANVEGYVTTINSEDYSNDLPLMSIEIPSELVGLFAGSSGGDERVVRVISALYYDVEHFFPGEIPGENSSMLGSGIVSTSLQCGHSLCETTVGINLSWPVVIMIQHSKEKDDVSVECVFWEFLSQLENTSLTRGQWSKDGCYRNATLSNNSLTVCECYHLTHFAILLSPVPPKLDPGVKLSLQLIGYIGVAVSMVTMALTVLIFISIKSLHNMRNYIHIHLCINLMIAQLIFVVGIDKSAENHVPVHCQAIAVLLHYFFLVSFMWMLMEGVVLYVALVFVFAERKKLYILGFTIASYGIPLLYMVLTLPLGFAMKVKHYGYSIACFLKPETHFIWAFIAPVIVIVVMNFVLFLIVARVMWKHQKRMTDKTKITNVKRWLRSAVFLIIIMGLTWIIGVLVLEVKALLPLTYIFTIMVAFQGVAIFLIFVPFSRQVREAFKKLWKVQVSKSTVLTKYFGEETLKSGSGGFKTVRGSIPPERKDVVLNGENIAPSNNITNFSSESEKKLDCDLEECKINKKTSSRETDDQENDSQENFVVVSNQFVVTLHASSEC